MSKKTNADVRTVSACLDMDKSKKAFLPGTFRTTTFYIIPKDLNEDHTFEIQLNVYGVIKGESGEYVRLSEQDSHNLTDELIDGHILFFEEKDDSYSELLKNGKMLYNTAEHHESLNENGEYEVTVYWIWPAYYEQLTDTMADGAVLTDKAASEEMIKYIDAHPDLFFCNEDSIAANSDRYDNADQFIRENVDYFEFEIIALE